MKLKYNKRSTEWLKKGIPSKIDSISLLTCAFFKSATNNKKYF